GRLRTYMTAQVHIVLGRASGVPTIPAAALGARDTDGRYSVRILGPEGQITTRKVEIGLNDKVTAEVRDGLAEGDIVVTGEGTVQSGTPGSSRGARGRGGPPMGL